MIVGGDQIQLGQLDLRPSQAFKSAGSVSMEGKEEISKLLLKLDAWIAYEEAEEKKRKDAAKRKKMEDDLKAYEMKLDMMEKREQELLELIKAQIAFEEVEMKEKSCPLVEN